VKNCKNLVIIFSFKMSSDSDSDMPAVHDDAQFERTQTKAIPGESHAAGATEAKNDLKNEYGYVELQQFGQSIEAAPIVQENAMKNEI
jgi:hypothetical protein